MSEKLRCSCGKWVARLGDDGDIYVWCKNCKKEVKLTPAPKPEPKNKGEPGVLK